MPPLADPIARLGFGSGVDYMDGEDRLQGRTYHVRGWTSWSDRRKVAELRRLAEEYGGDPKMRELATRIVERAGVPPRDGRGQCAALLSFVQNHVYYANEAGEQIQSPWYTLKHRIADCDDQAILLASLAESIGLGWRMALGGRDRMGRPLRWIEGQAWAPGAQISHIYVFLGWPALSPTTWAAAEPTIRDLPLGHDVVTQGLPSGVHGGADIGTQNMAGWGALPEPGGVVVNTGIMERLPTPVRAVASAIDWPGLLNAVVSGTITAAAVAYFVRAGRK